MFSTLFWQEFKLTTKSVTYFVFVLCLLGFVYSQGVTSFDSLTKPQPNQAEYGMKPTRDQQVIQTAGYSTLLNEWLSNEYATYPFGFIKTVVLSEKEQQQIEKILEKASQQSMSQLIEAQAQEISQLEEGAEYQGYAIPITQQHDYQQFVADMATVEQLIGRGSSYELATLEQETKEPMTYEDALLEFERIVKDDQVSGAYARIICDYFGIILGILPVFLGATICLRDRRSGVQTVVFTKEVSSFKLITARFSSGIVSILVPVFLFSLIPATQTLYIAKQVGAQGSLVVFYSYLIVWLIPSVVAVTGLSFLTTELFGGTVAIVIQLVWWFLAIFTGVKQLVGHVGLSLIPRFNRVGLTEVFQDIQKDFMINRLFFLVVGLGCLAAMIGVYQRKRGGGRCVSTS